MVIQHAWLIHACRPVHEKPQRAAAQRTKRGRDDAVSAPLQIRVQQVGRAATTHTHVQRNTHTVSVPLQIRVQRVGRSNAHARSAEYSYCICTITNLASNFSSTVVLYYKNI